mgnify:CR=1 FL=1
MLDVKVEDIIGWDTANWSQLLPYWDTFLQLNNAKNLTALELGSGYEGGLALWLALKGINTTCSGFSPSYCDASEETKLIHQNYNVQNYITYARVNALQIQATSSYDIICYKSILGGITRDQGLEVAKSVTNNIYKALKPGGRLFFAENLSSTVVHKFARGKFGAGSNKWRYFSVSEVINLHSEFTSFDYQTCGFLGCFGVNEVQRQYLGKIDKAIFSKILPETWNYILFGVATK